MALCLMQVGAASGQNIRGHYVSKAEADGTVYHTFPCTLFSNCEVGDLTFDITYKEHGNGQATINFTCKQEEMTAVDSLCLTSGQIEMRGVAGKIYIVPEKKEWKHRYSFKADMKALYGFFDVAAEPQIVLYSGKNAVVYKVKSAAWKSHAPVISRIFEMIRINELR